jgi:hypothetical protein
LVRRTFGSDSVRALTSLGTELGTQSLGPECKLTHRYVEADQVLHSTVTMPIRRGTKRPFTPERTLPDTQSQDEDEGTSTTESMDSGSIMTPIAPIEQQHTEAKLTKRQRKRRRRRERENYLQKMEEKYPSIAPITIHHPSLGIIYLETYNVNIRYGGALELLGLVPQTLPPACNWKDKELISIQHNMLDEKIYFPAYMVRALFRTTVPPHPETMEAVPETSRKVDILMCTLCQHAMPCPKSDIHEDCVFILSLSTNTAVEEPLVSSMFGKSWRKRQHKERQRAKHLQSNIASTKALDDCNIEGVKPLSLGKTKPEPSDHQMATKGQAQKDPIFPQDLDTWLEEKLRLVLDASSLNRRKTE